MSEQNPETFLPDRFVEKNLYWRDLANLSSTSAQKLLPYDFCKRHKILPLAVITGSEKFLTVLSNKEPSLEVGRELRFLAGMEVELETVPATTLEQAIDAAYLGSVNALQNAFDSVRRDESSQALTPANHLLLSSAPVPKLLETIISRGLALGASDIHLEYSGRNSRLRFRIDGRLREEPIETLLLSTIIQLVRRIKILASIDILELSKPADGSFQFGLESGCCALRVSAVPIVEGEKLVLRYLENSSSTTSLDHLGLNYFQLEQLKSALNRDSGCILLSGPTGSGKTTLLYSALEYLKKPELNITTIEEPVEKRVEGISQSQVDRVNGLGFSELLRCLLRQDPDVIMIGEIRERETAETALNASITGHLVLATVHASNVFEILLRLQQLVPDRDLLTRPLRLLSSQRLVPLNCNGCKTEVNISDPIRRVLGLTANQKLYKSNGCGVCQMTGIRGRTGVYEFLTVSDDLREALLANLPTKELLPIAKETGYLPFQFAVRDQLVLGNISPGEALRALGVPS